MRKKQLPYNPEAEKAILGSVLQKNDLMDELVEGLSISDFYLKDHQKIYSVFLELYREGKNVDIVTVGERLPQLAVYLADLIDFCIMPSQVKNYVEIIKEKAIRRSLIEAALEVQSQAFNEQKEVEEILNNTGAKILEIATKNNSKNPTVLAKDIIPNFIGELAERTENKSFLRGLPSGFTNLDRLIGGWQAPDLIIMAGRPGMGKTSLALNIGLNAIKGDDVSILFFSLEMSKEQIIQKAISILGQVNNHNLRTGFLTDEELQQVYLAAEKIQEMPLLIDDTPSLSTFDFKAKCRQAKQKYDIKLIIVDYLQLMRPSEKQQSREREIGYISSELKATAKELNVPVIALSQLNRKVEERNNKRPTLSDLRDSGAIEQDADIIMFLYNEDYYKNKGSHAQQSITELILAKHRHGPTGVVKLLFKPYCTAFFGLAEE